MNILLTNDDGITSEGFKTLVSVFSENPKNNLYISAPEIQQSAKSHSLTMNNPVFVQTSNLFSSERIVQQWVISGTPVDCVKIALEELITEKIDLIISGINHGPNLADDIIYSGTVAAALEGTMHGIPSFALSLNDHSRYDFESAARYMNEHLDDLMTLFEDNEHGININFPSSGPYLGSKLTTLGSIKYSDVFNKRKSPHGKIYYWIAGNKSFDVDLNVETSDVLAVENGFVSITPIKINFYYPLKKPFLFENLK